MQNLPEMLWKSPYEDTALNMVLSSGFSSSVSVTFKSVFFLCWQEVSLPPAAVWRRGRLALWKAGCLHTYFSAGREAPARDPALGNPQDAAAAGRSVPHSGGGQQSAGPRGSGGGRRDGGREGATEGGGGEGERCGIWWKRERPYGVMCRQMNGCIQSQVCVCVCALHISAHICFRCMHWLHVSLIGLGIKNLIRTRSFFNEIALRESF